MRRAGQLSQVAWLSGLLALVFSAVGCQSGGGGLGADRGSPGNEEVWAIRCITLRGEENHKTAEAYADSLRSVPGLEPNLVQVLSDGDGTHVFYGHYRRMYGARPGAALYQPDHLDDLERIRGLRFAQDNVWPFILASMDLLPTYRSSHAEWDLNNAAGYWSLQVAVFYNTDTMQSRRSTAEEYCRLLREQGERAYFHHGVVNSSVCVGTYPEGAIVNVRRENPLSDRRQVTTTRRIVDPQMLAAQERFPHNLHNGHTAYEIVRGQAGDVKCRVAYQSFPVLTPRAQRHIRERGE